MRRDEQIRQIKTLMSRLDAGVNVDAGGLRRNPTSVYVDADLAEREWREFFCSHPQLIGMSGDLTAPGDFFTVEDLAVPILATRDEQGELRAFVNSCRHRGAIVETESRGSRRRFTCEFHNWAYASDGTLVGLPKSDHFGEIDKSCWGLVELPAVERHGLLWVHPDSEGEIDVDALLGEDLADELESWALDQYVHLTHDTYEVSCNWKLAMDTFGETYHFPALHRNTINTMFHGNVQCYDTYGRNHRMLLARRAIDLLRDAPEDEWDISFATLPVYWLFPNVQLLPSGRGCFLVRAYPIAGEPGRHVSRIGFYARSGGQAVDAEDIGARRGMAEAFGNIIRDEDYVMSASQQRTADTGALDHVLFGRNEPALHHYHNTYRAALDMDPLPLLQPDEV